MRRSFDSDLYGSSLRILAPAYPTSRTYRPRWLADALPGLVSMAAPPWNQILALLSEAAAAPAGNLHPVFLLLPYWPAQPWWPLATRLARGLLWEFWGTPWISPAGKRLPFWAVGFWVTPLPS